MIAYIRGTVAAADTDAAVIENNGIGYRIFMPSGDLQELSSGDEVRVHIHMAVREDAVALYGFLRRDALSLFRLLIGVSGIGPKGALSVLSTLDPDDLRFAVLSDDIKTLSGVPGIGKKTAQKMILELRDRLDLETAFEEKAAHKQMKTDASDSAQAEAVEALVALGYPGTAALRAVRSVSADQPGKPVEDILKEALKAL